MLHQHGNLLWYNKEDKLEWNSLDTFTHLSHCLFLFFLKTFAKTTSFLVNVCMLTSGLQPGENRINFQ